MRLQPTSEGGKYFQNYPDAILRRLVMRASGKREHKAANVREERPSLDWQLAGKEPLINNTYIFFLGGDGAHHYRSSESKPPRTFCDFNFTEWVIPLTKNVTKMVI